MAKKVNNNDKRINYKIERIRTPMSREKLNDLYKELIRLISMQLSKEEFAYIFHVYQDNLSQFEKV